MRTLIFICFVIFPILSGAAPAQPIPYLGIEFRWSGDASADRFLYVERVAPGSPAGKAGIRPGDLITRIAGIRVDFGDELDFLLFMRKRRAGERLNLTVVRSGTAINRVVTLGALPEAARARWELNFRMAEERRAAAKATK